MDNCIVMDAHDNVATVLAKVLAGAELRVLDAQRRETGRIIANSEIPFGHKICLAAIAAGAAVIKYGETIGAATAVIKPGDYVHIHNTVSLAAGSRSKKSTGGVTS